MFALMSLRIRPNASGANFDFYNLSRLYIILTRKSNSSLFSPESSRMLLVKSANDENSVD